jgi:hypothetical protein
MPISITEKASRVVRLLLGFKHPAVYPAMQAYGFSKKDEEEGWDLLNALGHVRGEIVLPPPADTKTIHEIDVWENRWFPIAEATLARRFPAVAARFFQNLSQIGGPEVVMSVQLFLDRYDELTADGSSYGPEGAKARDLLAERGLTPAVINEARALMQALRTPPEPMSPSAIEKAKADAVKAEQALWAWYLEWSQVARIAIKQRALLHQLGFLSSSHASATDDTVPENGATTAPTTTAAAPTTAGVTH